MANCNSESPTQLSVLPAGQEHLKTAARTRTWRCRRCRFCVCGAWCWWCATRQLRSGTVHVRGEGKASGVCTASSWHCVEKKGPVLRGGLPARHHGQNGDADTHVDIGDVRHGNGMRTRSRGGQSYLCAQRRALTALFGKKVLQLFTDAYRLETSCLKVLIFRIKTR